MGAVMDRLRGEEGERVADIGTGSGAIALTLLHYLPSLRAVATDVSATALVVAKENAEALGLFDRIELREGDLCAPLRDERFDAIVSNPPYIPRLEFPKLPLEVLVEPRIAIDGGMDGLTFYRRFVKEAVPFLKPPPFGNWPGTPVGRTWKP